MKNKYKILIVDDEEFNLDILTDFLSDAGYEVISAADGEQGLMQLKKHPDVDVIVVDRMMPNMNGIEMLQHIKKDPLYKDIPAIMQTAAASSQQILEGIEAGVYYYLAKPYDELLLLTIVRSALEDYSTRLKMRDELQKQKRTLGLLEQARFRFRTLEETNNLCYLIANCFPNPDDALYGLNELMVNAIEHGNLGISYSEKSDLVYKGIWQAEIERRLDLSEYRNKSATLEFEAQEKSLIVTIKDQGNGFNWQDYIEFSHQRATDPNGRGIAIAKARSFHDLEYRGNGNEVVCKINL